MGPNSRARDTLNAHEPNSSGCPGNDRGFIRAYPSPRYRAAVTAERWLERVPATLMRGRTSACLGLVGAHKNRFFYPPETRRNCYRLPGSKALSCEIHAMQTLQVTARPRPQRERAETGQNASTVPHRPGECRAKYERSRDIDKYESAHELAGIWKDVWSLPTGTEYPELGQLLYTLVHAADSLQRAAHNPAVAGSGGRDPWRDEVERAGHAKASLFDSDTTPLDKQAVCRRRSPNRVRPRASKMSQI